MVTVTPWDVVGTIDYDKLIEEFGVQKLTQDLKKRLEKHAQKKGFPLHRHLRRNLVFAHRDLEKFLDAYEADKPVALYTGRSPSGNIHLGHMYVWEFTKWLQDVFDCELYFQFPDEEKFLFKQELSYEEAQKYLEENLLDVAAMGFKKEKTYFLIDTKHANTLYPLALQVAKKITYNQVKSTFGFTDSQNIGAIFYTAMQAVPAILPSIDNGTETYVLIPHAIDQDPHFRISRDVIKKLGYPKPASIQGRFLPGLAGQETDGKMSSSKEQTAIYSTDTASQIKKKINKYAYSGGRETLEEHRRRGGKPEVDVAYQWLTFFLEDDKELKELHELYTEGELLSGEMKARCIEVIQKYLQEHQTRRTTVKVNNFLYDKRKKTHDSQSKQ
ncbi:MAG: tryptophan--tRNA ligase [Candidatus Woesearchaeota archaeon]